MRAWTTWPLPVPLRSTPLASRWWKRWRQNTPSWRMGGLCTTCCTHPCASTWWIFSQAAAAAGAPCDGQHPGELHHPPGGDTETPRNCCSAPPTSSRSLPVNGVPSTTFTAWLGTEGGPQEWLIPRIPSSQEGPPAFLLLGEGLLLKNCVVSWTCWDCEERMDPDVGTSQRCLKGQITPEH